MKKSIVISASAIVAAMAMSACGAKQSSDNNATQISKETVETGVREFVYPLPTAFQVTDMLNEIGADYMVAICNDETAVDKYLTEAKRAINLGVYSADVCYASTYNQHQNVVKYMDVIRKLIDDLDMTKSVDPELPSKIENNENNKEVLSSIITDSFYDSYEYLNKNDRGPVSLLIVSGSWIEGLFLSTHISEYTFNNKEMVKITLTQKEPLEKLASLLDKYKGNESIDEMRNDLKPLIEIYSNIAENGISESQCESIREAVEVIRTKVVSY